MKLFEGTISDDAMAAWLWDAQMGCEYRKHLAIEKLEDERFRRLALETGIVVFRANRRSDSYLILPCNLDFVSSAFKQTLLSR